MFKKLVDRFLFNPYKFAKKSPYIKFDPSVIFFPSARFQIFGGNNNITIGSGTTIACTFIFESENGSISIGENSFINGGTKIISRNQVVIGSNVTIAWDCTIYDHNSHSLFYLDRRNDIENQKNNYLSGQNFIASKDWTTVKSSPIIIEDDVWIGFGVVILKGVKIGRGAIIGAMSVVRENVEPWTVVVGNPAVLIKNLNEEY